MGGATMNPGHELDALVAVRVMRWDCDGVLFRRKDGYGPFSFQPSTSIVDAWDVVERFRPYVKIDGRGLDTRGPVDRRGWVCRIWTGDGPEEDGSVSAMNPSASLAICLAALKAVGVEVPA